MRIALVGAYGAGKSTLTRVLHRALGAPVALVGPMADPVRGERLPLERCSLAHVFQLALRRYGERSRQEALLGRDLLSDGSLLHEWVYLMVLAQATAEEVEPRSAGTGHAPTADVVQARVVAGLARCALTEIGQHLGDRYDLVVHRPPERTLAPGAPITSEFQAALDAATLRVLDASGVPVLSVTGTLTARTRAVVAAAAARAALV